jgi:exopolysaccharide production protein ExoY
MGFEPVNASVSMSAFEAVALKGSSSLVKRSLDLTISCVCLLLLAPLMLFIGLAAWASDGGPMFFGHERIGLNGKTFRCWKFRSMVPDAGSVLAEYLAAHPEAKFEWELSHKLKQDPRITPIGRFLRASSLDELPQLFNVLSGEMSLVGPRPIVTGEVVKYGSNFGHYCSCRPGITGLWQISGRSDVSYDQRVAFDTTYALTQSAWLDLRVLFMTIPAVLMRRGSY